MYWFRHEDLTHIGPQCHSSGALGGRIENKGPRVATYMLEIFLAEVTGT